MEPRLSLKLVCMLICALTQAALALGSSVLAEAMVVEPQATSIKVRHVRHAAASGLCESRLLEATDGWHC